MKPSLQNQTLFTKRTPAYLTTAMLVLAFALSAVNASAQCFSPVTFTNPSNPGIYSPYFMASADYNGDGKADLIISSWSTNVTIYLGNGDGTYGGGTALTTGTSGARGMASGDFNGDGKMDLVIADQGASDVVVMLGNGDGTFGAPVTYSTGSGPYFVIVADFNNDGKPDLVTANSNTNTASVLYNNGAGSFTSSSTITAGGSTVFSVTVGDFDNDGKPDVVTANQSNQTVSFAHNNGNGTFGAVASVTLPFSLSQPCQITSGDFDGDGKDDLAVENRVSGNNVYILKGNGAGGFSTVYPGSPFASVSSPFFIMAADFNNDGKPDLVTAGNGATSVSVLLNNGSGGFTNILVTAQSGPWSVLPTDINNDGRLDMIVANSSSSDVSILLNSTATASAKPSFATECVGGGALNLTGGPSSGVSTYSWTGPNSFSSSIQSPSISSPTTAATGAYKLTITAAGGCTASATASVSVYPAPAPFNQTISACGSFTVGNTVHSSSGTYTDNLTSVHGCDSTVITNLTIKTIGTLTQSVTLCPGQTLTIGGKTLTTSGTYIDVITGGSHSGCDSIVTTKLKVLFGNSGAPVFSTFTNFSADWYSTGIVSGDFNSDGNMDFAVANQGDDDVYVYLGDGHGNFSQSTTLYTGDIGGSGPTGIVTGDFNGDGYMDLITSNVNTSDVSVFLGNNDGTFNEYSDFSVTYNPWSLVAGDFNGDGKLDLAVNDDYNYTITILLGDGAGNFTNNGDFTANNDYSESYSIISADFNNDGKADLALANEDANTVSVLYGAGDGTFNSLNEFNTGSGPYGVMSGDFDGDGKPDLAVSNVYDNTVSVLLNDGTGNFGGNNDFAVASNGGPQLGAVADLNGDGIMDIVVADQATNLVSILTGVGDGTFNASVDDSVDNNPYQVIVADFNNDGKPDLATANDQGYNNPGDASILLNKASLATATSNSPVCTSGSNSTLNLTGGASGLTSYKWAGPNGFTSTAQSPTISSPTTAATGTYTITVTASGGCSATATAAVVVNAPKTFSQTVSACGSYTIGLTVHTSSGTYTDVIPTVGGCDSTVTTNLTIKTLGTHSQTVSLCGGQSIMVGSTIHKLTGTYIDRIAGGSSSGCDSIVTTILKVFYGTGTGAGSYTNSSFNAVGPIYGSASADFNGDGKDDIVLTTYSGGNTVYVFTNNGSGGFSTSLSYSTGSGPRGVVTGDFNNDGHPDFVVADQGNPGITMYLNNGSGAFTRTGPDVSVGHEDFYIVAADFNGDGKLDIATANESSSSVTILLGNGSGGFSTSTTYTPGGTSQTPDITAGDFNGDGYPDIAMMNVGSNNISILMNNGNGTFNTTTINTFSPAGINLGGDPPQIISADFDHDGKIDLAVCNYNSSNILVLKGDGTGHFTVMTTFSTASGPFSIVPGDFNGDGNTDIAVATRGSFGAAVYYGNGSGSFGSSVTLPNATNPWPIITGDFNGDGKPDISVSNNGSPGVQVIYLNTSPSLSSSAGASPTSVCSSGSNSTLTLTGPAGATTYLWSGPNSYSNATQSPTISDPTTAAAGVYTLKVTDSHGCSVTATTPAVSVGSTKTFSQTISACGSYTVGGTTHTSSGTYTDLTTTKNGCDSTVTTNLTINSNTYTVINKTICAGQSYTVGSATLIDAGTYIDRVVGGGSNGCDLIQTTNLKVLFGNGGTAAFSYSPNLSISSPYLSTSADFNGDGKADLVVTNNTSGQVVYFQGNGDGTFAAGVSVPVTGSGERGIVSADFNGDGKMDIAIANQSSNTVSILFGNGNGTFTNSSQPSVGSGPYTLTTADLNNDGKPDLAVANGSTNTLSILINNGTGGFTVASTPTVGTGPQSVTVADFNGDGKLDLAADNQGSNNVSILLGNGDGTYGTITTVAGVTLNQPWQIANADFDGDGKIDLVVNNRSGNSITILKGDGLGGFTQFAGSPFTTGINNPLYVITGDFNKDGKADIAVDNYGANTVSILLGNGAGGFTNIASPAVGSSPWSINSADFNGDGIPDIAAINAGGSTVSILLGNGTGGFGPLATTSVTAYLGTSADFNNDGELDLMFTTGNSGAVQYLKGNGNGTFAAATSPFTAPSTGIRGIVAADFNGDGNADLAIANQGASNVYVYLGNGSGGFTSASAPAVGSAPYNIAAGDMNNDGKPDLVVPNGGTNTVSVLLSNGNGTFTSSALVTLTASTPTCVTINDFNNDGNMDFATADASTSTVNFVLGNGDGTFRTVGALTLPFTFQNPAFITSGDYDGDGNIDLAVANRTSGNDVYILKGNGSGGFSTVYPGSPFPGGTQPLNLTTADFNGDGHPDIAVGGNNGSAVTVLTSNGSGGFNSATTLASISSPYTMIAGDFNNDGKPDIAAASNSGLSLFLNLTAKASATASATTPVCTNGTLTLTGGPASASGYSWSGPNSFNNASQSPSISNPTTAAAGVYTLTVTISSGCTASASTTVAVNAGPAPVNLGSITACGSYTIGANVHTATGVYTDHLTSVKGCDSAVTVNLTIKSIPTHSQTLSLCSGQTLTIGSATLNASGTYVDRITGGAHDGCDSIVTTNLTVFYGNGVANFSTFTNYPTAASGDYGFTMADFNKDGIPDLATANNSGNSATLLLGNGSGGFGTPTTVTVSGAAGAVAADFNGDGKPDLAISSSGTISVFLGTGSGGFTSSTPFTTSTGTTGNFTPLAYDFNGDGKMDIATGSSGSTITVMLGKGDGTFTSVTNYTVGSQCYAPVLGDFNGDGKMDIAIPVMGSNNISILKGNGDGTFNTTPLVPLTGLSSPRAMCAADFNGDGILDIGVVYQNTTSAAIFLGNGTGGFGSSTTLTVGNNPQFITAADFNGDGKLDAAVANYNDNTVSMFLGNGSGGFSSTSVLLGSGSGAVSSAVLPASSNPQILIAGDFNGDGKPDLAASNYGTANVSVWLNLKSLAAVTVSASNVCTSGTGSTLTLTGPTGVSTYAWRGPNSFTSSIQIPSIVNPSTAASGIYTLSVTDSHSCTATATTPAITVNAARTFSQTVSACGNYAVGATNHTSSGTFTDLITTIGGCDSTVTTNLTIKPLTYTTVNATVCAGQAYTVGAASHTISGTYVDHIVGGASNGCDIVQTTNLKVLFGNGLTTSFSYTPPLTVTSPYLNTIADFNGDGKQDMIVTSNTSNITYLQGNGDGTFAAGVNIGVTSGLRGIVSADFNGDGKMDIAMAHQGGSDTYILYGNGNGTFGTTTIIPTGTNPYNLNTGDLNNDGKPDLVVGNTGTNTISVLINNGAGGFTTSAAITVGTSPGSIVIADFNNDGNMDIATGNLGTSTVSVLLGNGTGGFSAPTTVNLSSALPNPGQIASGDMDGDGKIDLIVENNTGNTVSVLKGNGSGGFSTVPGYSFTVGSSPFYVAVADFNRDGKLDIASANNSGGNATILLGNGSGLFTNVSSPTAGSGPWSLNVGDFNGDGTPDIDVVNSTGASVSVLLGNGTGGFGSVANGSVNGYMGTTGDFNGDGIPDLMFTTGGSAAVQYMKGNGDGTFAAVTTAFSASTGSIRGIATADFNGDGKADIALANQGASNVFIFLGNGNATFTAGATLAVGVNPYNLSTGDFNNDGKADLAVANSGESSPGSVSILLGNGSGGFTSTAKVLTGSSPSCVAVADFNNDGFMDIATANQSVNVVSFALGNGDGTFKTAGSLTVPFTFPGPAFITSGDYDGDGNIDLAVVNRTTGNNLYILKGNGSGGFSTVYPGSPFAAGSNPLNLTTADFNGDGHPDIAVGANSGSAVTILVSNGSGGFGSTYSLPSISSPYPMIAADFNGDGKPDLAAASSSGLSVFLNRTSNLAQQPTVTATTPICPNATLTLTGTPSALAGYAWSGPNFYSATGQNQTLNGPGTPGAGVYSLTVTDSRGCTGWVSSSPVVMKSLPTISVTPASAVCLPVTSVALSASGSVSGYTWSPATNLTTTNAGLTETAQISQLTFYTVSGTASNGCSNTTVVPIATVATGGQISPAYSIICSGGTKTLTVLGAAGHDYQWQISSDNTNWTNITGATNTTYTTASGDGNSNKFYRLMAQSNSCWNVASTTGEVDVSNPNIVVTATNVTDNSLTLNWSPTGTGNYSISYSGPSSATTTSVTPPKTITGLSSDGTYSVTVTQTGVTGCPASGTITGEDILCAMPTGVTLSSPAPAQIQVSWTGTPGADYRVYYRPLFSYTTYFTKDVSNASSVLLTKQGANNIYASTTYEVYVSRLDCPTTGVVGQGTNPTNVTTLPTVTCATPVIDSVRSLCPVQIEVFIHDNGVNQYNVFLQRVTPSILAVNSYGVSGTYFTINTPYSGDQYIIAVEARCGSALSSVYVYPGNVTVKPLCDAPTNLVLSNPTCHGFTASWNSDECLSNSASAYDFYLREAGTINYNSYGVPLPGNGIGPHELLNFLAAGRTYQVFVRSVYNCNGFVTYGPTSQVETTTTLSSGCRDEDAEQPQENKPATQQYSPDNSEVFSLYPNPNTGKFVVDLSRLNMEEDAVRIEVINMLGQTVLTNLTTISGGHMSEYINLPGGTAAGTYIVRLTAGKNVYTAKINVSK